MKYYLLYILSTVLTLAIVFAICYAIAVSDLPEWVKFFLLN